MGDDEKNRLADFSEYVPLYLEFCKRVEHGEMNLNQSAFAREKGKTKDNISKGFRVARKQLANITEEQRGALTFRITQNLIETALRGTSLQKKIVEEAETNPELYQLAHQVTKDVLDRLPETSKEGTKVQVMNINQNRVEVPRLVGGDQQDVIDGLAEMSSEDD